MKNILLILLTALAPIFWGTTYIATTEWLPPDKPLIAAMLRTLPAGMLLTLISWQLPNRTHFFRVLILSFLNIACFQVLLFVAAYRLPGGIAAILGSIQPLVILLLAFFVDAVRPSKTTVFATITSIIGLAFLLIKPSAQWDVIGILAGLFGAIAMATGVFLTKRWQQQLHISVVTFTGWQLLFGGAMLVPIALIFETMPMTLTLTNVLGYGYLAVFGSLIAYSLWFRGVRQLPTVAVSILGALSPITATILGWIFLNQSLTAIQLVGLIVVLLSIVIIQQQKS